MDLSDVAAQLEAMCPSGLAESWDNVGLLIEPWQLAVRQQKVRAALLANDLTPAVYDEALKLGVQLVISYHPPLFRPLRRILGSSVDWQQRLLARALADGIAVYSPHTAWDSAPGGLNDWLIGAFDTAGFGGDVAPVTPAAVPGSGCGRWAPLAVPLSLEEAVAAVKRRLGLSAVQVATPASVTGSCGPPAAAAAAASPVFTRGVAVCAGSGASALRDIGDRCDLLLTGEMAHHDLLWHATQCRTVILTGHSNCERPYLPVAQRLLTERMPLVKFAASQADRDPLIAA